MASTEDSNYIKESTELVAIKRSGIHRWGGFARKDIEKDEKVIEYVGEKIDKKESAKRCQAFNPYVFEITDDYDIDGDVSWNQARYLNHSCDPNCEAVNEDNKIWIVAAKSITKDEELTFNYGYDLVDYEEHKCGCGAKNCLGYIVAEEYHEEIRKEQKTKKG